MTTMRVIVEEMLSPVPTGTARYSEELTRALIQFAPPGCSVEGIVAASTEPEYAHILNRLPGLANLYKSSLARRELVAAWQHGFTRLPGGGIVHAPSLLAPLAHHDRLHSTGHQTAVTIHDAAAWTHPETLPARRVSWQKAMARRAQKHADAVVVPTHAVAARLREFINFGDRVRVISKAVSPRLARPDDADERAERLDLPQRYLLAMGGLESRGGLDQVLAALALPGTVDLPLLIVGPDENDGRSITAAAAEAGLAEGRVVALGYLSDDDLSVVLDRAVLLVYPSLTEGFGLPVLEAFRFGTPVVHSDAPGLAEVAADAGVLVAIDDLAGYPERLAEAMTRVAADPDLAARLSIFGQDRAGLFTWQSAAEQVWQLHADL